MISGVAGSSGSVKPALVGRIVAAITSPGRRVARKLEHTPLKLPCPEAAGPETTPTVTLRRAGSRLGEEEIE